MNQHTSKKSYAFDQPNQPQIRIQSPQHHKNNHHPSPPLSPQLKIPNLILQNHPAKVAVIARTNSQSKLPKKASLEKSIKEKQIEKGIKYTKPNNILLQSDTLSNNKNQMCNYKSQRNLLSESNFLQCSVQTIHKTRDRSKSRNGKINRQLSSKRYMESDSIIEPSILSVNREKTEQYHAYWKAKAHQYLENNIQLMQDVNRLTKQNQKLKQQLQTLKTKKQQFLSKQPLKSAHQASLIQTMRKNNIYYMTKIQQLQKQLKSKQVLMQSFSKVIKDQSRLISGDNERINLMNKMKQEVAFLHSQIDRLGQQLFVYQCKQKPFDQHRQEYAKYRAKINEHSYRK